MLRDNKPTISNPDYWGIIGGHIENGETPEKAVEREVEEELGYKIKDYQFFKKYTFKEIEESSVFFKKGKFNIKMFKKGEGQKIQFLAAKEIQKIKIAYEDKQIIQDYFKM